MIEKNQPVNFWFGTVTVVDDDPEKLGRVRVRIFGKHHSDPNVLKNEDLPLAHIMMPGNSASLSGVGHSPTGILPGSWVVGFYLDPDVENMSVILGTLPTMQFPEDAQDEVNDSQKKDGKPQDLIFGVQRDEQKGWVNKADSFGFCDPKEVYPTYTSQLPAGTKINASDVNSKVHSTLEYTEHDFRKRKDTLLLACDAANKKDPNLKDEPIQEPFTESAQYTKNQVYESQSGHIQEYDDTPGKERTYRQHKSGTFEEIHHDGTKVTKVYGTDFELCLNGKTLVVNSGPSGTSGLAIIVNGDIHVTSTGNVIQRVYGNLEHIVHGTYTISAKKGIAFNAWYGNITTTTHNQKDIMLNSDGQILFNSKGATTVSTPNQINLSSYVNVSKDVYIAGKQDVAGGASSLGYAVIITPPKHPDPPVAAPVPLSPQSMPSDMASFPYNKGPVINLSTQKSHESTTATGWDYPKSSSEATTYRKSHYLNNFSPIQNVKEEPYQGNDGAENAVTTDFTKFDAYTFTYKHDKKFEWYKKPYSNKKETNQPGQRFRESDTVSSNDEKSFGYANGGALGDVKIPNLLLSIISSGMNNTSSNSSSSSRSVHGNIVAGTGTGKRTITNARLQELLELYTNGTLSQDLIDYWAGEVTVSDSVSSSTSTSSSGVPANRIASGAFGDDVQSDLSGPGPANRIASGAFDNSDSSTNATPSGVGPANRIANP